MSAASPRPKRGREEEQKGQEANDPLIAAVLQNNVVRFQQLWDQIILESEAADMSSERDEHAKRIRAARTIAVRSSNVPVLRIMANTRSTWMSYHLFSKKDLEAAITENDLALVELFYTVQPPPFDEALFNTQTLSPMHERVDHFIRFATTDEMCQLGARLFGFLLRSEGSFMWLVSYYGYLKKPGQVAAVLKWSAPWWKEQRAIVGVGRPILLPNTARHHVGQLLRKYITADSRTSFDLYQQLTASELWQVGEFCPPNIATIDLHDVLEETKGAFQETAAIAPLVTEWAQYMITTLGADWTGRFADDVQAVHRLAEKPKWLLALLFDALTVSYLANLFVIAWEGVMAQRFLRLAELMATNSYLLPRNTVLQLRGMFPGDVATAGADVLAVVEGRVPLLSRIYRRVALLLRDVADAAPPELLLGRRTLLRERSRQLLATVAAAEPEHMRAVRQVLEETAGLPQTLAEWTAFLPYARRRRPSAAAVVPLAATRRRYSRHW